MNLKDGKLCIDCEEIFTEPACPKCGSTNFHPLADWIKPLVTIPNADLNFDQQLESWR